MRDNEDGAAYTFVKKRRWKGKAYLSSNDSGIDQDKGKSEASAYALPCRWSSSSGGKTDEPTSTVAKRKEENNTAMSYMLGHWTSYSRFDSSGGLSGI